MQNSNIKGTLKDGTEFTTITPGYPNSDEELVKTLRDNGVDIKAENPPETPWWTTIIFFFTSYAFTHWCMVFHHATVTRWR